MRDARWLVWFVRCDSTGSTWPLVLGRDGPASARIDFTRAGYADGVRHLHAGPGAGSAGDFADAACRHGYGGEILRGNIFRRPLDLQQVVAGGALEKPAQRQVLNESKPQRPVVKIQRLVPKHWMNLTTSINNLVER